MSATAMGFLPSQRLMLQDYFPVLYFQVMQWSSNIQPSQNNAKVRKSHLQSQTARDLKRSQSLRRQRKWAPEVRRIKSGVKLLELEVKREKSVTKSSENTLEDEIKSVHKASETIIQGKGKNPAYGIEGKVNNFGSLGLKEEIIHALENQKITFPTPIQSLAVPRILGRESIISAAQTGSGKTIAYLAPIVQALRDEEEEGFMTRPSRPRACVVLPVRELALQILQVAKSLAKHVPFRSEALVPGRKKQWIRESLQNNADIVIGTPRELLKYKDRGKILFSDIEFIVLDEADTLLDPSFRDMTFQLLRGVTLRSKHSDFHRIPQCILTMATLPRQEVLDAIKTFVPDIQVVTAGLHKILPHVTHKFVRTLPRLKPALLLKQLDTLVQGQGRKVMVFANSPKTCAWLSHFLRENNVDHATLHGHIRGKERRDVWETMMDPSCLIVISTDIAARGLDTTDVSAVISYDCPMSICDYLHRSGRTGRLGATFKQHPVVLTMITGFNEAKLAAKVRIAASKGEALRDIELRGNKQGKAADS